MKEESVSPRVDGSSLRMLGEIKEFADREPGKAVATAFGVGLLMNLLPPRMVLALIRPALLALGVAKAVELCCPKSPSHPEPIHE